MTDDSEDLSRRRFFQILVTAPIVLAASSRLGWTEQLAPAAAPKAGARKPGPEGGTFAPTPECADSDEPTPEETEGPFFTPHSPKRTSLLEPGMTGTTIVLTGRVFSRECKPLAGVLIDFWHADDDGEYDNQGFKLRGHQFTDAQGRYRLETIVPGLYPGRTRHYHVKLQAPKSPVLTTQLYFPDEPRNRRDGLFRPDLLVTLQKPAENAAAAKAARFHFMLDHA